MLALLSALAVLAGRAAAQPAPASIWWTDTKADAVLLLKLRLPCTSVRSPEGCSVASAQRDLARRGDGIDPATNLMYIKRGFPLRSAHCVGGGTPDRSGTRFRVFRCNITIYDDSKPKSPVIVSGRLLVTVTGTTLFSWAAV